MEELFAIKDVYSLYDGHQFLVMLGIMIVAFYPLLFITKRVVSPGVNKIAKLRGENYEEIIDRHHLTARLVHLFIAFYLMFWGDVFDKSELMSAAAVRAKDTIVTIYLIFSISTFLLAVINIGTDMYKTKAVSKRVPIGLHTQIIKIIIVICAILTTLSLVMSVPISSLFTSIGAAAALLTFVFKDTVLGLMASIQLTFQDIIKVGDWVTLPSYNADGDIEKITITVVVIRNFDKTSTTVPTYAFLTTGVRNWRTMFQAGGRRIKRSISLDMDTVKICDQKALDKFKKMPCMKELAKADKDLFDAKKSVANITMFRKYIEQYLNANEHIHTKGFTFMVRQLDPTSTGIPLELYIFTKDTNWGNYEAIQADIFDHLLGIMPEFELKAFQTIVR
jgi:miniconductance mechanosensitive channel